MATFRVRTPNPGDSSHGVAAGLETFADLPDSRKTVHAAALAISLIVLLTEVGEVLLEDCVQLVSTSWNILILLRHTPERRA